MRNPRLYALIGLPGCGKSTYREDLVRRTDFNGVIASTDDSIEELAEMQGLTYDEVYVQAIGAATKVFEQTLDIAFKNNLDIIVDRTNLSIKTRDRFMKRARKQGYDCTAIIFACPNLRHEIDEWNKRLGQRPGKTIPPHILKDMRERYNPPSDKEGFCDYEFVDTFMQREPQIAYPTLS